MRVLVDTSIWSLALRRASRAGGATVAELTELISEDRVVMLGAIRQELLSGINSQQDFRRLRDHLRAFPDESATTADHELAADSYNRCRAQGVQGSNTDFLLCAVAQRGGFSIFTTDKDFGRFAVVLPVQLHEPRDGHSKTRSS